MMRSLSALALLLLASASALAADPRQCGGSNVKMTECIWDAYEEADRELNALWPHVLAAAEPTEWLPEEAARQWKADLLAAQRAWITFKEKDCEGAVTYEYYGGSGAGAAIGLCLYDHTRARIDNLNERYTAQ